MSLIKSDDKEILRQWANNNSTESYSERILSKFNDKIPSYWQEYEQGSDIKDYCFQTVPELTEILTEELTKLPLDEQMIKTLVIGAFKRQRRDNGDGGHNLIGKANIPEFIYAF